jgi:hypothetical protein
MGVIVELVSVPPGGSDASLARSDDELEVAERFRQRFRSEVRQEPA